MTKCMPIVPPQVWGDPEVGESLTDSVQYGKNPAVSAHVSKAWPLALWPRRLGVEIGLRGEKE